MPGVDDPIGEMICESALGLFLVQGVSLRLRLDPVDPANVTLAASIGFVGDAVRGALVVMTTARLVVASLPPEARAPAVTESRVADWIGELTNQLLGRVKSRLLRRGTTLFMSTPVVVVGRQLRQSYNPGLTVVERVFEHDGEPLAVRFEVEGALALGDEAEAPGDALAEGDFELF